MSTTVLPGISIVDDFGDKVYSQCLAMVENNGTVLWAPIANLKSSCKLDLTYFPFDDQVCQLKFGSWAYDGSQVDLTSENAELEMQQYIKNGGWDVIKTKVVRNVVTYPCCPHEPYPDVTFSIYLRRRSLYYVINIIVPCILLSCLSLFGFFLPVGTGEKVSLGLTVLLAFYVLGLSLADRIPETSEYIPLIGLYLTIIMVLTAMSIAMCVYVIQLHHRGDKNIPVPPWLYKITTKYLAQLLCMTSYIKYQRPFYENGLNREECEPLSSGYTSDKGTMTLENVERHSNFRKVPKENNGSCYISSDERNMNCHQNFNNSIGTEDPWVRASKHISIKKTDLPISTHVFTNEKMWHDMALVWDRFCLLLEFIAITVSTISILIIMPLLKDDNFAS